MVETASRTISRSAVFQRGTRQSSQFVSAARNVCEIRCSGKRALVFGWASATSFQIEHVRQWRLL